MTIRALLFDADEVLQWPQPNREGALLDVLGFVPEPYADFVARLHAVENTTLTGERDFLEALTHALRPFGVPERAIAVREWLTLIDVDHALLDFVTELRQRGYCCALATNQQPHRARFMAERLGYDARFDRSFYSCELGLAKPDPRYFRRILTELGIDAESALFVDDKPLNVAAARSVGVHAAEFINPKDGCARASLSAMFAQFGIDA